jgi:transcriptional regulator of acetoin/glycerol metabolism
MQRYPLVNRVTMNRARTEFFSRGTLPTGLVSDTIIRSWQRSLAGGVDAEGRPNLPILSRHELDGLTAQNRAFLDQSRPVMENLYEQVHDTSSMVILADAKGVILHSLGDADFIDRARKVSLRPGGVWSESVRGTNAIGTALAEQAPVVVHSGEHFSATNHFLTCAASPIFDPFGALLGVLDVSGDSRVHQQHTMALVRISAQQIENQMFSSGFESEFTLHFHSRPEFIGTLYEAIAVFAPDGRFLAANRSALLHLGLDRYQARAKNFSDLFDFPLHRLLARGAETPQPVIHLPIRGGITVFARLRGKCPATVHPVPALRAPGTGAVPAAERERKGWTLDALSHGDAAMERVIGRVRKVLGHDIPLLIEGESGTGKELFARAVHGSGSRAGGPFVALNCAAIPEGLIEAELFGYQEGAFTGARRKGSIGRIREADSGTLFLDEIGDMPLALQARLLRVLQERAVTPLGGGETKPVDIAIICATNRRLRDEIVAGRFREDLYYRLNGLLVALPRLRQRDDRLSLARTIVAELTGSGRGLRLSPEVLAIFEAHPWPGNVRQLHSVLRTAVALVGDDDEIAVEHLSEDFIDQYRESAPLANGTGGETGNPALPTTGVSLDRLEALAIRKALDEQGGNISAAARCLGISRNTLYRKLQEQPEVAIRA